GIPGSQMCKKPGSKPGSKPGNKPGSSPMDKISKGQQGLKSGLEGIKNKLEKGGGSAKDFAQAAARQAALRKALQDIKKEQQEKGKGDPGLQEIIDEMNKMEVDLVNKKFDSEWFENYNNQRIVNSFLFNYIKIQDMFILIKQSML
ncbi:MAG: hypothetical protein L3J12_04760, partial [Spirochaetales bacterium]|nr:hypothetical protein [Spirochaetales bacterium]